MKNPAVKLPRKRFFKLRGNVVELAVGMLVMSLLQSEAAQAATLSGTDGSVGDAGPANAVPEHLAALDPDAIRTIPIDDLKALLDAKALAALGLDADFAALFDTDPTAAVRKLESAFREKIKAGDAKIAAIGEAARGGGDHHDKHADADGHHASSLAGDFSPLWLLAGLGAAGGGAMLAGGGGGSGGGGLTPTTANVAPVATADAVTTREDTPVTFDVRTNDSDADGGTLSVTQINGSAITTTAPVAVTGGSISLGSDGRLTFTPTANYNGTPTFTYTLADGQGGRATATVALTVTAVNDAPVATADSFTTAEDTAVTIAVLANDTDVDGDTLRVTQVNDMAISTTQAVAVTGGSVILNAAGNIVFTPAANYNGSPSFTYTVADAAGATASATVTGTVTAVNDAPVNALPAVAPVAVQGLPVVVAGLSVSDVDAGTTTITTTLSVGNGVLTAGTVAGGASGTGYGTASVTLTGTLAQINATLGTVSYTASPAFAGTDTLTFVTSDGQTTDTDTLPLLVSQVTTGVVIDGYVAGARIFFDANGNGVYDDGEVFATTDANGRFSLVSTTVPKGMMIAIGGINTDTGLPNTIALKAPVGSSTITPLTTIVAELVGTGLSVEAANAQVLRAFGLPAGLDLGGFDFLSNGDADLGFAVQKVAIQIATVLIQANAAGLGSTAIGQQLAAATGSGAIIALGDPAQLQALLQSAGLSAAQATQAAQAAASINQAVVASTSPAQLVGTVRDLNQPGVNLPTIALNDAGTFGLGVPAVVNVLANDRDPEGSPLHVVAIDGKEISLTQPVAVAHGTVSLNADGTLSFTPAAGFMGNQTFVYTVADAQGVTSMGKVTTDLAGPVLPVSADQVHFAADHAVELAAHGVTTVDAVGDVVVLSDADAQALIAAGIHFAEADTVTLTAEGTHLGTTLKGLQSLNVDMIAVGAGVATLSLDAGGALASLDAAGLPQFDIARSSAALDVTLNVDGGAIDADLDLGTLATALNAAGIDHLGVTGSGQVALNLAQATALADNGLDFTLGADVTLDLDADQAVRLAVSPTLLAALHVDHIDVTGDAVGITDAQAANLVAAGVDFVSGDNVTLTAEGTHLATTLKGLQSLHVDSVAVGAGIALLAIDAGVGLDAISAADLPSFTIAQSDAALDITLNVQAGTLDSGFDLGALASALGTAGIDHIGVAGSGEMGVSLGQATGMAAAGIDFAPAAEVVLHLSAAELGGVADDPSLVAGLHIDAIDVQNGLAVITDAQAGNLIDAGLHFAEADAVTVAAAGTHLSTSLRGLNDLKVDSIAVAAGVATLHVDAGDLTGLSASDLPQFDIAQTNEALDVTLRVDVGELDELTRLADALKQAGIDHIAINQDPATLPGDAAAELADITARTGIDFSYENFTATDAAVVQTGDDVSVQSSDTLYRELISAFEAIDDHGTGGAVELQDGAASSLAEAGMLRAYTADTLVVDATGSGDKLLTTLKEVADLGVDEVRLADQHGAPVYIDLGIAGDADAVSEIGALIASLDHGSAAPSPLFTGAEKVALVMDAQTAEALAHVDGALDQLAALGITEVDVLAGTGATAPAFGETGIEVKLIGQDDELYRHLHHDR